MHSAIGKWPQKWQTYWPLFHKYANLNHVTRLSLSCDEREARATVYLKRDGRCDLGVIGDDWHSKDFIGSET